MWVINGLFHHVHEFLLLGLGAGISYPIANSSLGWQGALSIALILVLITILMLDTSN